MSNVTPIRPTKDDEISTLINESDSFVLIGKTIGDLKLATNVSLSEALMMLEGLKLEIIAGYLDGVLEEYDE